MVVFGSKITAPQAAAEGEAVVLDGSGKVPQGLLPEMSGGSSEPSVPVVLYTDTGWDQLELFYSFYAINASPNFTATDVHGYLVDLSDGTRRSLSADKSVIAPGEVLHFMGNDDTLDNTFGLAYVTYLFAGLHMQTPPVVINIGKD